MKKRSSLALDKNIFIPIMGMTSQNKTITVYTLEKNRLFNYIFNATWFQNMNKGIYVFPNAGNFVDQYIIVVVN